MRARIGFTSPTRPLPLIEVQVRSSPLKTILQGRFLTTLQFYRRILNNTLMLGPARTHFLRVPTVGPPARFR